MPERKKPKKAQKDKRIHYKTGIGLLHEMVKKIEQEKEVSSTKLGEDEKE